jgi:hypothetical protein
MRPEKFADEETLRNTHADGVIHLAGSQENRGRAHASVVAAGIGGARRHQLNVK